MHRKSLIIMDDIPILVLVSEWGDNVLKIKTENLNIGVKLGKDLFSADGKLLLGSGTIINKDHLRNFSRRKITEVYIAEEYKAVPKDERIFADIYQESISSVKEFLTEAKLGQPLNPEEITKTVGTLHGLIFDGISIFKNIQVLKEKDNYLYTHSLNVAILCMLVGKWLSMNDEDIKQLGIGGLLHDIGKVFIADEILNKTDRLTPEEYGEMKKHCFLGYHYINKMDWVEKEVVEAVLTHHERMDGSGYPNGIENYGGNRYAPVLAVCDVYDAVTSERVYSSRRSPFAAADILWEESFGKLDPVVSGVFFKKIGNLLLGSKVRLSNDEIGLVVFSDAFQPTRPLIMVGDTFYNLAVNRDITIMEVID